MKRFFLAALAAALLTPAFAGADVIAQWDFNGTSPTTVPGGPSNPTPSIGAGTASLLGGVTASFSSGIANGGSSDPVNTSPPNYGWQTTTYAAQGTGDNTRGVQFLVNTTGFDSITVSYDLRHSNTSSRYERLQYTLDGGTTWDVGTVFDGNAGDTWFNGRFLDLSAISGAANNPLFGIRVVATFDPSNPSGYLASNPTSSYATTGTWRFDMVTISGTPIPEPTAAAAGLLALAGLAFRRNRG